MAWFFNFIACILLYFFIYSPKGLEWNFDKIGCKVTKAFKKYFESNQLQQNDFEEKWSIWKNPSYPICGVYFFTVLKLMLTLSRESWKTGRCANYGATGAWEWSYCSWPLLCCVLNHSITNLSSKTRFLTDRQNFWTSVSCLKVSYS